MSIYHDRITLGTAATLIVPSFHNAQQVIVHNDSKSSNEFVFVGDSAVTSADGLELFPEDYVTFNLQPGDSLYAVSAPTGLSCSVLASRK